MPVVAPLIGAGASIIGGIAGGSNKRPPSLDPSQQKALDSTVTSAAATANGPAVADPTSVNATNAEIAEGNAGANNRTTNALVSRGLGNNSGLLAAGLVQNSNQSAALQNQSQLALQQQALQNKQHAQDVVANLTKTQSVPGQSTAGAVAAGAAPGLAYTLQQYANNRNSNTDNSSIPDTPVSWAPSTVQDA